MYKIAFSGLGSIAKRHVRNVCSYLESKGCTYKIDLYRSSLNREIPENISPLISDSYLFSDQLVEDKLYDAVFVTNPTSMHYETLLKFKDYAKAFFIEKPVFDSSCVDERIFTELQDKICYVACPLRYNPVLMYVRENIDFKQAIAVRAISSSYLPDWRPGQDYRQCYSAHRELGGGVGIDLIHEWDYLTSLWGMPEKCYSIQDQISSLEIDSDDIAIYIAKAGKTTIELHLDYFGRQTIRTLDLFMPDDTIHCDIINGKIDYLTSGKSVTLDADRNEFQMREIVHFFDIIEGKIENDSTAEHGYAVLKLAKGEK